MSLWSRITNPDFEAGEVKIPIHGFIAATAEWQRGEYSRADVIAMWSISVSEESDLDALKAAFQAATDKADFRDVFKDVAYLAELGKDYLTGAAALTRLQAVP